MGKRRVVRHEVVQPLDQSIKLIALTKGQNTIVDTADYEFLSQWNWHAVKKQAGFYAVRTDWRNSVRKTTYMHTVLCGGSDETDHRDRDTLNNRSSNLRPCTHTENQWNRGKQRRNTSGYKGVTWSKRSNKWQVQTSLRKKIFHLGYFIDKELAYKAYCEFTAKHKGEFGAT